MKTLLQWIRTRLGRPRPPESGRVIRVTGFPEGEFTPERVIDDEGDVYQRIMAAAIMNHKGGGPLCGHIDADGNLHIEE